MWQYVDTNNDGEVDEHELSRMMGPPPSFIQAFSKGGDQPPTPKDLIRMCDKNGDRKCNKKEVHDAIDNFVPKEERK